MPNAPGQHNRGNSLTEWERLSLIAPHNLADGHARDPLDEDQLEAIQKYPHFVQRSSRIHQTTTEESFRKAFFDFFNQNHYKSLDPSPELHYSSSVSIDIAAKILAQTTSGRVRVMSPTFDNIPALLRRSQLDVLPCDHHGIWSDTRVANQQISEADALFAVVPNNPTGTEPTSSQFAHLANLCAQLNCVLVVDFTFRAYSSLHTWDQYQLATTVPNLKCLLIEDTGKVWPAADLKVGILAASRQLKRQAAAVSDELLLNVPSPTLDLLTELVSVETARTKYQHGPAAKHRSAEIVALNRQFLRSALESLPLSIPFIDSTISVEWIRLPELWSSSHLAFDLAQSGVAVLPGAQFFWDDPAKGERWIRVALMRDPSTFKDGVIALASSIQIYSRRKGFSS